TSEVPIDLIVRVPPHADGMAIHSVLNESQKVGFLRCGRGHRLILYKLYIDDGQLKHDQDTTENSRDILPYPAQDTEKVSSGTRRLRRSKAHDANRNLYFEGCSLTKCASGFGLLV